MPCDVVTKVSALYSAFTQLVADCCSGITPPSPDECVVDAVWTIYDATNDLLVSPLCSTLTETVSAPGEPGECLDPVWLDCCLAWIQGITCGGDGCPEELCFLLTDELTPAPGHEAMEMTGSDCVYTNGGYTLFWSVADGAWKVQVGGTVWTGPEDKGDPRGLYPKPDIPGTLDLTVSDCP